MMSGQLDDFLKGEPAPEAEPVAEAVDAPAAAPETVADADDEPEAKPAEGDVRTVPLAALEGERAARKDWKEKALKADGEMAELRRQLEDARKPQPAPAQQYAPQPINPVDDPQGFIGRVQEMAISNKLDMSEMMLRKELGAEAVEAVITEFKAAATANPALYASLYQQPHPYEWAAKHVETLRLQRDIGDDPAAYRAKLRAEWEAEQTGQPATAAPAQPARAALPNLPPSLARAASAAPRSAPAFSGPMSLQDVLNGR